MKHSAFFAAILCVACINFVNAQTYPAKPIRLIVPSAPGGGTDIVARLIAQQLAEKLATTVVVDNRPGISGMFGTNMMAKAPADGYTIGMAQPGPLTVAEYLYPKLSYDPVRDFAPVILANESTNVLAVYPSLPVHSIRELVALSKTRPLNGACNIASVQHLLTEMLNQAAGTNIKVIPYRGGALAANDVIGGRVELMWSVMPVARPFIQNGRLRAIAVASKKRSPFLPDVPTTGESGWPDIIGTAWNGVVAPAGTPKQLIDRLNLEIARALSTPDVRQRFRNLGMEEFQQNTPSEFQSFLGAERVKWEKVIRAAKIRIN